MTEEQLKKLTDYLNKLYHKLQDIEKGNANILHQISKIDRDTEKIKEEIKKIKVKY
jgi:septal ring factor EnvC (AmiA/AmiB activator)